MRGSPLIRFIILAIALAATGAGLTRVTSARNRGDQAGPVAAAGQAAVDGKAVPFRLLLSAPAAEVAIDTGGAVSPLSLDQSPMTGMLVLDPENPRLSLTVRWKNAAVAGEHRFAKLTLEVPGQDTFTRVFDAAGDIDDFLELPFPAAK